MLRIMILGSALLASSFAFADEVVVTPGARVAPAPAPAVVEHHEVTTTGGCSSTTVHKENDLGDSKTVKKSDC